MSKVTSKDGTEIAYEKRGAGPAVILVEGAMGYRGFGAMPHIAELLAPEFTVHTYDRRGRGESSDKPGSAVQDEIDDIAALIDAAGGLACVYGISSGACLALEAAIKLGNKIKKLALYEPPYSTMPGAREEWDEYRANLNKAIAENRRGDAVALFMRLVGVPADQLEGMRQMPMWPMMEAIAPTLAYDAAAIGETRVAPTDRVKEVKASTLIMDGGANLALMPFMHASALALSKAIPGAEQKTLEGQTHDVSNDVIAKELIRFFAD